MKQLSKWWVVQNNQNAKLYSLLCTISINDINYFCRVRTVKVHDVEHEYHHYARMTPVAVQYVFYDYTTYMKHMKDTWHLVNKENNNFFNNNLQNHVLSYHDRVHTPTLIISSFQ